jgi:hypothetical protein
MTRGLRGLVVVAWATLALVAVAACASGAQRGERATSPDPDVLLGDEIQTTTAVTARDAVRQLRPHWLRRRGPISLRNPNADAVVVYLDGVRLGGPESLRTIGASSVLMIRHLNASDATTRFGAGHAGGALLVQTN